MSVPDDFLTHAQPLRAKAGRLYRAPGRVNLIGEHTDYNLGWVLPAAMQLFTWVAAAPRADRMLEVTSLDVGETTQLDVSEPLVPRRDWTDYVAGVAWALQRAGIAVPATTLMIKSELPFGGGLSSSAALEVAVATALLDAAEATLPPMTVAQLCQAAENEFVGARSGLMDQFIVVHGLEQHALLLDCRALRHEPLLLPAHVRLVVANTMVKHAHASGGYNTRREECEQAVERLRAERPPVASLRDVTAADLAWCERILPPSLGKRVRHVVTENARVLQMSEALRCGDLEVCGTCLMASHASLRDDYEVSTPELDAMVAIASRQPGVYGARMTGGGFGGCTITLVDAARARDAAAAIAGEYQAHTGIRCETWITGAADGIQGVEW